MSENSMPSVAANGDIDMPQVRFVGVPQRRGDACLDGGVQAFLTAASKEQWLARGHFFLVADGMGAHAVGELASKLAVDNIPHTYFKRRDLYPPAALRQAIRDANATINAKGQSSVGFSRVVIGGEERVTEEAVRPTDAKTAAWMSFAVSPADSLSLYPTPPVGASLTKTSWARSRVKLFAL